MGSNIKVARAALHFWEEPCISGSCGSGTVFFSGCSLRCVYCQNGEISSGKAGAEITGARLYDIFFELKEKGAANINLVTAGHFLPQILPQLKKARENGLGIPFVYNTSSYETVKAIQSLNGICSVYLPDLKYISSELSRRYSACSDYFETATGAIEEMVRQTGSCTFGEDGMIRSGVIVRHLVLPGHAYESKKIIKYLYETYGSDIYMSIMSQYTPIKKTGFENLDRKLTKPEYDDVVDYAVNLGVENAYIQDGECAEESFIPQFDLEGVFPS